MQSDRKSLLITGAGHGIGKAAAQLMAARGWIVGVNDLKEEFANEAVESILAAGGQAFPVVENVATRDGVEAAIAAVGYPGRSPRDGPGRDHCKCCLGRRISFRTAVARL
jgi:NAD(P)-dependent dehydrogenase (short-subunit alcohol dehydrogenase family)